MFAVTANVNAGNAAEHQWQRDERAVDEDVWDKLLFIEEQVHRIVFLGETSKSHDVANDQSDDGRGSGDVWLASLIDWDHNRILRSVNVWVDRIPPFDVNKRNHVANQAREDD